MEHLEAELPVPIQKKPLGLDHELVELLWENGQVVLHSQTHQKTDHDDPADYRQVNKHYKSTFKGCATAATASPPNLIQDSETVPWIHCQVDDPSEKEFSCNFLSEILLPNPVGVETQNPIQQLDHSKVYKSDRSELNHLQGYNGHEANFRDNQLLSSRFQTFNSAAQPHNNLDGTSKCANTPSLVKADLGSSNRQLGGNGAVSHVTMEGIREYSARTIGSSHGDSNQVANDADTNRASSCGIGRKGLTAVVVKNYTENLSSQRGRTEQETNEQAITSSSGGSGRSISRTCNQSTGTDSAKRKTRKTRDGEDSECQSEAAVLEPATRKKTAQKSKTSRKCRAAEVHNLSERRRRDRINEKMRALQELLPHSNKSDKASMLDEAIEYMKSLQLQIQMMWLGSGMVPLMFPGVQHYMPQLTMGIGPQALPASIRNAIHLPRLPLVDQAIPITAPTLNQVCQTTMLNPMNYHNQLQNLNFSEQYANYTGFHPVQSATQPMNIFSPGSNMAQQSHSHNLTSSSNGNGPSLG